MRHVIIGRGPAGLIAAETVRQHAARDDILLIGNETHPPYSRMALPHLLMGAVDETSTWLRKDPRHFSDLRIEQRSGHVERVDGRAHRVVLRDGQSIAFDRLLIATGARPLLPSIPGVHATRVLACWTLDDACRIMQHAQPGARVALIGAGFIGCLLIEALAARRVRLTVIEKRDRMAADMLGEAAAGMVRQWWQARGVCVRTATRVIAIEETSQNAPLVLRLSNREMLETDLVICATGAMPNIDFLRGSGIRMLRGVLVDATMRTNVPGIYAAGDCAQVHDHEPGAAMVGGMQDNAADQAFCAGLNMCGRPAYQRAVRRVNVLDTMGLAAASFGQWRGVSGGQWVELNDRRNFRYLRLEFRGDVLVGSSAVGLPGHIGVLQDLIRRRTRLGGWKDELLRDPLRLPEAYRACVQRLYERQ